MVRIILRLIFILSISFNIAFILHLLGHSPDQKNIQLNMTEKQREYVNRIHLKVHKDNKEIKDRIRQCQKDLMKALKEEELNHEQVSKCIDEINNLQKKIQLNTIEEIIQVKKVLNKHQCDCLIDGLNQRLSQVSKPCDRECCQPK